MAETVKPEEGIMNHLKRAFDWLDKLADDETKSVLLEKVFEFLEDKLIDAYDVVLVPDPKSNLQEMKPGFNLNAIIRDLGSSKRIRMDEADEARRQEKQGTPVAEVVLNTATARDVAELVITRAVIQSDFVREELTKALTVGLNILVPDPAAWQKGRSL